MSTNFRQFDPEIDFKFLIDKKYVDKLISRNFEKRTKLTDSQWGSLTIRIPDRVFPKMDKDIIQVIREVLDYGELLKRNQGAESIRPCYLVKLRDPDQLLVKWEDQGCFFTEEDAKAFINYHYGFGIDEEWEVDKLDQ